MRKLLKENTDEAYILSCIRGSVNTIVILELTVCKLGSTETTPSEELWVDSGGLTLVYDQDQPSLCCQMSRSIF